MAIFFTPPTSVFLNNFVSLQIVLISTPFLFSNTKLIKSISYEKNIISFIAVGSKY